MSSDKKIKSVIEVDNELLNDITELINIRSEASLKNLLTDLYNFDISVIIDNLKDDEDAAYLFSLLDDEEASEVILEVNDHRRDYITEKLSGKEISGIVSEMHSDDATDFVSELDDDVQEEVLEELDKIDEEDYREVKELLNYDENTAGGIMAKEFIAINENLTIADAIKVIQDKADEIDHFYNFWVVDNDNRLKGIVSLRRLVLALKNPNQKLKDFMNPDVISVEAHLDQEEVAKIFQSYDLVSVPVVDSDQKIIGKISFDDVMDVIVEEHSEDIARMTGTDAGELEKKSSFQIAKLRLPWILITLFIEFIAVFVIKSHSGILERIILLAAFMPIISAISGNTGLQSAAIIVRALDTGYINISRWWVPVFRQFKATLIIGFVVGIIVGILGFLISDENEFYFGMTVAFSMFISINIAGLIGTVVPMISKKLGFDPALTSGPFETAFQDVVGITIFLTIATYLLSNIY